MPDAGDILEARFQRLFLAQGIFAERELWVAADGAHKLMATDIDVMISEYSSGFHLTRRHAECKSGRRIRVLDRVLWLNGVRSLLGADASYLVVPSFHEPAVDFARRLDIDVMTVNQLETWETAFEIKSNVWPSRSDYRRIDPIRDRALSLGKAKRASELDILLRDASQFIRTDSWRSFGYGRLNRLLRMLKSLSDMYHASDDLGGRTPYVRYAASALLVRLSQYLLAVCRDVSRVPVSDLGSYLSRRLTFGDQDPDQARGLVEGTVDWIAETLRHREASLPAGTDVSRLFLPPTCSEALIALIRKLLIAPNEAKYLPVAMEVEQFGQEGEVDTFPRLGSAWRTGRHLAALVRGFAVASVGVEASVLRSLWDRSTNQHNANQEVSTNDAQPPVEPVQLSL